jgi:uncharacterized protein YoxC
MEFLPIVLTIAVVVLTITLVVVGVYLIQVLQRVKYTLDRVNTTIDLAEEKILSVSAPFQSLGNMANSMGAGLRVFESFVGWMNRGKKDRDR